jgi:hypothetical protein
MIGNRMAYTLGEAARATAHNKSSILKALRQGKISGVKDVHGQWCIEPCELHRVYPPASPDNGSGNRQGDEGHQLAPTKTRLSDLKAMLDDMRAQRDDMRGERDHWREQAQRLALAAPKPEPEPKPEPSWWRWLRSTG